MIPESSLDTLQRERARIESEHAQTHVRLNVAELRRQAWQVSRFFGVLSLMLIAATLPIGVFEVDVMRRERAEEVAEIVAFRKDYLEYSQSLGKRMDTQAEATIAQAKGFREALVEVRRQLRENTNVTAKAATANTQIAREAVKATNATTQMADKIAAAPDPVVRFEVPKAAPPVVAQAPAPPAAHVPAQPPATPAAKKKGSWFKRLFGRGKRGGDRE